MFDLPRVTVPLGVCVKTVSSEGKIPGISVPITDESSGSPVPLDGSLYSTELTLVSRDSTGTKEVQILRLVSSCTPVLGRSDLEDTSPSCDYPVCRRSTFRPSPDPLQSCPLCLSLFNGSESVVSGPGRSVAALH